MEFPVVTALVSGIIIIFQMLMTMYVINGRVKYKVSVGDGGEVAMERRIRAHGNLAENAAIILVALALLEFSSIPNVIVMVLGGWFVIARMAHVIGMVEHKGRTLTKNINKARFFGALSTMLIGMILGVCLIYIALTSLVA